MASIERSVNIEEKEKELLAKLQYMPEDACDRSTLYRTLGQYFIEDGNYNRAKMYLDKAANALEQSSNKNSPSHVERLKITQKTLQLAMKAGVTDILMELEAEGVYK